MYTLNPWLNFGRDRGIQVPELQRINRRESLQKRWNYKFRELKGRRFLITESLSPGTYVAMTVTNLQSLASDSTDPYAGWQSARVDNQTTLKATDYEVQILLSTANTAPSNEQSVYVYVVPWIYDGSAWTPGANFSTTTRPTGSEGTCSFSEPNSMKGPVPIPYKVATQPLDLMFSIVQVCGFCPDGWSLALRNGTGAALSTGCVVSYRPLNYTSA